MFHHGDWGGGGVHFGLLQYGWIENSLGIHTLVEFSFPDF